MNGLVIHGIPTEYGGISFRSRVEAKWAAFFDELGWTWEYEPIDLEGYIPDFILMFKEPMLVEVKADMSLELLNRHTQKIDKTSWENNALIVGGAIYEDDRYPVLGLARQDYGPESGSEGHDYDWSAAKMFKCAQCGNFSFFHLDGWWRCPVCLHYEGDGHLVPVNWSEIQAMWRRSGEKTKWTKK